MQFNVAALTLGLLATSTAAWAVNGTTATGGVALPTPTGGYHTPTPTPGVPFPGAAGHNQVTGSALGLIIAAAGVALMI